MRIWKGNVTLLSKKFKLLALLKNSVWEIIAFEKVLLTSNQKMILCVQISNFKILFFYGPIDTAIVGGYESRIWRLSQKKKIKHTTSKTKIVVVPWKYINSSWSQR